MRIVTRITGLPTRDVDLSFTPVLDGGDPAKALALVGVTVRGDTHIIWLTLAEAIQLRAFLVGPEPTRRFGAAAPHGGTP